MPGMFGFIHDFFNNRALAKVSQNFLQSLEDEATEEFLEMLLDLMKLAFLVDSNYRKNIKNFTGLYRFKDREGGVNLLVKFHNGEMDRSEDPGPEAHVTVTFKNSQALRNYLLSFKKDFLKLILKNEILVTGNFNYLYKFMFMANHPLRGLLNLQNQIT